MEGRLLHLLGACLVAGAGAEAGADAPPPSTTAAPPVFAPALTATQSIRREVISGLVKMDAEISPWRVADVGTALSSTYADMCGLSRHLATTTTIHGHIIGGYQADGFLKQEFHFSYSVLPPAWAVGSCLNTIEAATAGTLTPSFWQRFAASMASFPATRNMAFSSWDLSLAAPWTNETLVHVPEADAGVLSAAPTPAAAPAPPPAQVPAPPETAAEPDATPGGGASHVDAPTPPAPAPTPPASVLEGAAAGSTSSPPAEPPAAVASPLLSEQADRMPGVATVVAVGTVAVGCALALACLCLWCWRLWRRSRVRVKAEPVIHIHGSLEGGAARCLARCNSDPRGLVTFQAWNATTTSVTTSVPVSFSFKVAEGVGRWKPMPCADRRCQSAPAAADDDVDVETAEFTAGRGDSEDARPAPQEPRVGRSTPGWERLRRAATTSAASPSAPGADEPAQDEPRRTEHRRTEPRQARPRPAERSQQAGAAPASGRARGRSSSQPAPAFAARPAEWEVTLRRLRAEVQQQLSKASSTSLEERRRTLRELMLLYHPDKNRDWYAKDMFQFVNASRGWFLAGS